MLLNGPSQILWLLYTGLLNFPRQVVGTLQMEVNSWSLTIDTRYLVGKALTQGCSNYTNNTILMLSINRYLLLYTTMLFLLTTGSHPCLLCKQCLVVRVLYTSLFSYKQDTPVH